MKRITGPIRWGIAGPGWVASDFIAPALVASSDSELVACVGSSRAKGEAFAAKFGGCRVHDSVEALMNDPELDAVYIALPNAMHHAAVLAGAKAGKHLLCEKPFALTAAHAREMVQACNRAGIVLRIAHQIRTDAAVRRCRELVLSGRLGRPANILLQRSSIITPRHTWRAEAAQSGVVYDVCVHLIDLAQWILGQRIVEVSAFSHPDRGTNQPDDTFTLLGRTERDCHVVARATREAPHSNNNIIIEAADASLTTSPLRWAKEHVVSVRNKDGVTDETFPASPAYGWQVTAFERELLHGERSVLPDGEDAAHTVAVTQTALQAILERRILAVPLA